MANFVYQDIWGYRDGKFYGVRFSYPSYIEDYPNWVAAKDETIEQVRMFINGELGGLTLEPEYRMRWLTTPEPIAAEVQDGES